MLIKNLKQKRVIPYLLAAPSGEEGCKRAHVSKAAVYKWLKSETFKGELRRERNAVIGWALAGHSSGRTIFELPIPI